MYTPVIITDLDNTLYDWNAFFAPSFRAMVHSLARETKIPEHQLESDFAGVYRKHESLEYAFAIQELPSLRKYPDEEIKRLIGIGRGAFRSVQRRRLRLYPGVAETLSWFRYQGYTTVAVSNSPIWTAQIRIWELRVDGLLDGLIAWQGPDTDRASLGYASQFVMDSPTRKKSRVAWLETVSSRDRKPSTVGYLRAIEKFGGSPETAWVIGDSIAKDLNPGASLGTRTIHAKYGTETKPSDMETLLKITHWSSLDIKHQYEERPVSPDYSLTSFADAKNIITRLKHDPPTQSKLFDWR